MNLPIATVRPKKESPPLYEGQHLDAKEFHRRYLELPDIRAELIDGVVHMSSPVWAKHATPHGKMVTVFGVYSAATPGTEIGDNPSLRPDAINEIQPNAMLYILPEKGGSIIDGEPLEGVPELIAEISNTTKRIDLTKKFKVYGDDGVQEYIVWRVQDGDIDWYHLIDGAYQLMPKDAGGIIRSKVFPGLWIPIPALANGELSKALSVLQQGLQSPEHAEFVKRLAGNQ